MEEKAVSTQDAAVVENVVLHGDLSGLGPKERINYYNQLCEYLGLSPVTQPFKIIKLQGKDTLYATKDATEQLRKKWAVSVDDISTAKVEDVYIVTVKGHDAKGRTDTATGVVTIGGLKGDNLANALMKAETKAKRRFTLSICGLGVLDETEIETIPNAVPVKDVSPVDDGMNDAVRAYLDDAKLDKRLTAKQHEDAITYVALADNGRMSEIAAAYAEKLGDDTPLVMGEDKQTGPTNDELADKAFDEGGQNEIF